MAIEIVDLPNLDIVFFYSRVSLPGGATFLRNSWRTAAGFWFFVGTR